MMARKLLIWLLPIVSGIILIFSYPPFSVAVLPFIGFVPLLFFLSSAKHNLKKCFLAGFVTGLFFFGGVIFFVFDFLPLDWISIHSGFLGLCLITVIWLIQMALSAVFIGFFSLGYAFLTRSNFSDIVLIPSLWVVFEFLRAWWPNILFWGKETLLGPHTTSGHLAYAADHLPLLRATASFGGIYLVAFIIVLINCLIFLLLKKKLFYPLIGLVILIVSLYFIPINQDNVSAQKLNIAVVQTKIPSNQTQFKVQRELLQDIIKTYPEADAVVFPESANFYQGDRANQSLVNDFLAKGIVVVDTTPIRVADGKRTLAVFYDQQGGTPYSYQKRWLVPMGEYLPLIVQIPAQIFSPKWVEQFQSIRKRVKGVEASIYIGPDDWRVGTVFCSESFSPSLHRDLDKKGAKIFFNLSNLSFSYGSESLDAQTEAALRFRAVESGKYVVRATNYGHSYIVNNHGEIVAKTADLNAQFLPVEAELLSQKTIYAKYGDWILIFALAVLLLTKILNRGIIMVVREHLNSSLSSKKH